MSTAVFTELSQIEVGATARFSKTISDEDIAAFARLSGDYNPLHMNMEFAQAKGFPKAVAHGMLLASFVSTMIGMQLPGAGALWLKQSFRWILPVFSGDSVEITLTVKHKSEGTRIITLDVSAANQHGKVVMSGDGAVMLPPDTSGSGRES